MLYPAFSAYLPSRNLFANQRITASVHKAAKDTELRKRYRIDTPPDREQAIRLATNALQHLDKFLNSRPIAEHTKAAFQKFRAWRERPSARPQLAIDAGCGCGQSTSALARLLPDADVVGVDKSVARLSRNVAFRVDSSRHGDNAMLLRAELVDFWRLCLAERCRPDYHFLLYPNPYPKCTNMKRRWHGHPVFPVIVALGGRLELRASWDGYLSEFRAAYEAIRHCAPNKPHIGDIEELTPQESHEIPLTNFEAKYMRVGQQMYGLVVDARNPVSREQLFESKI